ncbi:unnamed protein product [Gulo gulo]|uniref:Uncharacterized protein n=1 Tax=Gulo gulo TaxID=48420 RepID=A0A9X9Q0K1_GULGU|nr:unnamed protein product [Gulo gulo]
MTTSSCSFLAQRWTFLDYKMPFRYCRFLHWCQVGTQVEGTKVTLREFLAELGSAKP